MCYIYQAGIQAGQGGQGIGRQPATAYSSIHLKQAQLHQPQQQVVSLLCLQVLGQTAQLLGALT
jgi:hypothetical protein